MVAEKTNPNNYRLNTFIPEHLTKNIQPKETPTIKDDEKASSNYRIDEFIPKHLTKNILLKPL